MININRYVIRQEEEKDCGASCLASIVKYYNGYVPLEIIRNDTLTDNNGTNFDIEYTFKKLESTRYISDGDKNTVVYKKDTSIKINTNLEKIAY